MFWCVLSKGVLTELHIDKRVPEQWLKAKWGPGYKTVKEFSKTGSYNHIYSVQLYGAHAVAATCVWNHAHMV